MKWNGISSNPYKSKVLTFFPLSLSLFSFLPCQIWLAKSIVICICNTVTFITYSLIYLPFSRQSSTLHPCTPSLFLFHSCSLLFGFSFISKYENNISDRHLIDTCLSWVQWRVCSSFISCDRVYLAAYSNISFDRNKIVNFCFSFG